MKYGKNYCEEKEISTSELNEAQKTLYYVAENMKVNKSISEEGYRHFQMAIQALEQESILDKIRAEIMKLDDINPDYPMDRTIHISRNEVLQIIDKYKVSEETVDEIEVGDEVVYHEHTKGVVVRVMLDCHGPYYVLCANGGMMIRTNRQSLEKTGRHFPQITEVLELMK